MTEVNSENSTRLELNALLEATKNVLEYKNFEKASRAIFDSCRELIGAKSGYVALLSEDGAENELVFLESGGLPCSVDPELPMPIRGLRAESYKSGKAVYENDFMKSDWIKFMPGGHVTLKNVMFAPLNLEGKTVGIMGLANKESHFTEKDAQLASAFSDLAAIALHNSRTIERLEQSQMQCIDALDREDLYSDIFAHDIRNVLSNLNLGIHLFKEMLKREDITLNDKFRDIFNNLDTQIVRGKNLVSNITKLSKIKEVNIQLEVYDALSVVKEARDTILESTLNNKINIAINTGLKECLIKANDLLKDIFENILINAIEYNESEIIEINVKIEKIENNDENYFKFQFIDNGMGIPDVMKKRLFTERIEKENRKKGMGLGLLLVGKILKLYDSTIQVESRDPDDYTKGTNFIITFPEAN